MNGTLRHSSSGILFLKTYQIQRHGFIVPSAPKQVYRTKPEDDYHTIFKVKHAEERKTTHTLEYTIGNYYLQLISAVGAVQKSRITSHWLYFDSAS